MKLAFVSDFYYPSIGGTQMLCKGVAEWFREQGNEIEIITSPDQNRGDLGYVVGELPGLRFDRTNILLEKRYDAVFVFADLFSAPIITMNPREVKKSILVLNLDENVYRWIKEGRIDDIDERIEQIRSFTHVVSFCKGAPVNRFLEENGIEYHFIPNFSRDVMYGKKSTNITKESLGIKKKVIFNHGLIEQRKNQLNLMKRFIESGLSENYHLIILGSPRGERERDYFIKCKQISDSSDSITMFKGTNNEIIVNSLLLLSDIYVLSSFAEGLPLVLLEAMSTGLPWISTPAGGVPGVLGGMKSGVVMSDFTLCDLEKSVKKVIDKNSRKDWESLFTVDRAGQQYSELLC